MTPLENAKQMAKRLRTSLEARNHEISHSAALEMVAQQLGYKDWNTASARLPHEPANPHGGNSNFHKQKQQHIYAA